jgi:hypothetical protein
MNDCGRTARPSNPQVGIHQGAGGLADDHLKEGSMDTTTLLIIIVILLLVGGGGWYGRGRWY